MPDPIILGAIPLAFSRLSQWPLLLMCCGNTDQFYHTIRMSSCTHLLSPPIPTTCSAAPFFFFPLRTI